MKSENENHTISKNDTEILNAVTMIAEYLEDDKNEYESLLEEVEENGELEEESECIEHIYYFVRVLQKKFDLV